MYKLRVLLEEVCAQHYPPHLCVNTHPLIFIISLSPTVLLVNQPSFDFVNYTLGICYPALT